MASFDIDLDDAAVREALGDLKDDWNSTVEYQVGTTADYAVYLEYGRGPVEAQDADALQFENENGDTIYRASVSGHQPYPFFYPAVREFQANPEGVLRDNTSWSGFESIPNAKQLVRAAASAIENQAKKNASANSASGRSPGTHPDHPQRDSGNLVASISAKRIK